MAEKRTLLLGTRKGLLIYERGSRGWKLAHEAHLAVNVPYAWKDRRTGLLWCSLQHGHWGPKLSRSSDGGKTWEDVPTPVFPRHARVKDEKPASVLYMWVIAPTEHERGSRVFIGTEPGALFVSDDAGRKFTLCEGLWNQPTRPDKWFGAAAGTAEYPAIHSIWTDPRNARRILVGISVGGVFESVNGGKTWTPRNKGLRADFMPDPYAEVGHDPHLMAAAPSNPDVLWQQNHCGIFRSTDGGRQWEDVSEKKGPARFGFAVEVHDKRADTAWVIPAQNDDCRVPIDRALAVCRTENGGKSWTALRRGLPQKDCYDIVYRHALDRRGDMLVFGSTTGNLYVSDDGGEEWRPLAHHLPLINSVRFS